MSHQDPSGNKHSGWRSRLGSLRSLAVTRLTEPTGPAANRQSALYGGLGCLGGGVLGLGGGLIFLSLLSLVIALLTPLPSLEPTPSMQPDLRLVVDEAFLNRYIEQPAEGSVSLDILPGNQLEIRADTTIQAFGLPLPVQVTGLLGLQLSGQSLTVQLLDTRVSGLTLPPELANFFAEDIAIVNQDLQQAVDELATGLGQPVRLTNVRTSDSQIQLELRVTP